jgi:hypothetical protein
MHLQMHATPISLEPCIFRKSPKVEKQAVTDYRDHQSERVTPHLLKNNFGELYLLRQFQSHFN